MPPPGRPPHQLARFVLSPFQKRPEGPKCLPVPGRTRPGTGTPTATTNTTTIAPEMHDLRFAFRQLLQSPVFTVIAVTALGLGIGAATTAFAAFNTILLKPIPWVTDPGRLVSVTRFLRHDPASRLPLSAPDTAEIPERSETLGGLACLRPKTFILTDGGGPERLLGCEISANTFSLLGVKPWLGRDFTAEEEGPRSLPLVILGHTLWVRRYGADPALVGRTISISDQPALVVGVMPPDWRYPAMADLWSPLSVSRSGADWKKDLRGELFLEAVGRLRTGVNVAAAAAEMEDIANAQGKAHPEPNGGMGLAVHPLRESLTRDVAPQLKLLLGAVLFVQLIACANVASLLLARNSVRAREFAIRMATGASRGQIVRQLTIEGLLLGAVGATVGYLIALWGRDLCQAAIGHELPFWIDFGFDLRVFTFTTLLSLASIAAFALAPALQTVRSEVLDELREGARGSGASARQVRLRHALVVGEIALALVLLVGAGLMVRSDLKSRAVFPGYDPDHLLTFRTGLPPQYFTNTSDYLGFFAAVRSRLLTLPGVQAAAAVSRLPTVEDPAIMAYRIEGEPAPEAGRAPRSDVRTATQGYFETLRIPLRAGRDFAPTDTTNAPAACIIDEAFAQQHFPGTSPLGRKIQWEGEKGEHMEQARTIVGVVGRVRSRFDNRPGLPMVYFPATQWPDAFMSFTVRVTGDPSDYVERAQQEVFAVNPKIPIYLARPMRTVLEQHTWDRRFFGGLFAAFAGIALFLAAMGIYGLMAYTVGQRTPEIGLCIALGAQAHDVLRLVLRQGARLTLLGLLIGLAAALSLTRLLERVLFEVSPHDLGIFTAVPLLLGAVALLACLLPAWRATRIHPMAALRHA